MSAMTTIRLGLALAAAMLLGGCKIAVISVEGGEVQATGSDTCIAGIVCIHAVNDTYYDETFTAVPYPGWAFVKWNSGDRFVCGDSTRLTCRISSVGTEQNKSVQALIASDVTYYMMPVFRYVGFEPVATSVEYDYVFDLETGANIDFFFRGSEYDIWVPYSDASAPYHARILPESDSSVAFLTGTGFEQIDDCDAASAVFSTQLNDTLLTDNVVVLVKTGAGNVYKLGEFNEPGDVRLYFSYERLLPQNCPG